MNLQPVYPAKSSSGSDVTLYCSDCHGRTLSGATFADLDAKPGTYHCLQCIRVSNMMGENQIREALIARDRREIASRA